jgi:hypothetical protein
MAASERNAADSLLEQYLSANDSEAESALQRLLETEAAPIFERTLRRRAGNAAEEEEVTSAARSLMLAQLLALRRGERSAPIENFRGYASQVAYSAWAESLREKNPQRNMLLNRLQYLLENRTARKEFALWESGGRKWCGLERWERTERLTTPKLQWLHSDAAAVSREIFRRRGLTDDLTTLVTRLLEWLETPIELHDLLTSVAEIWQISDRTAPLEAAGGEESGQISPEEELAWQEYLRWLWREMERLSPQQCAAFILHSEVLAEFEEYGIASLRTLAPRIGLPQEILATLWREIPLNDLRIADALSCTRQQVINLRRVARDKLGKAWTEFSGAGNNLRVLASLFL